MSEEKEVIKKAWQMVFDLCEGKKKWEMSVPVDEERDPDVVIGAALQLLDKL